MLKVRKSITISRRADEFLRMLAEKKGKSQSKVIEELIEKEADEYDRDNKKKRKLEAFERILGSVKYYRGKIGDKTIHQIKEEIADEI